MNKLLSSLGEDTSPIEDDLPPEMRQEPHDWGRIGAAKEPIAPHFRSAPRIDLPHENERNLPASLDAEMAVLCSVLLDPACLDEIRSITPDHFHHPAHKTIFQAIYELREAYKPIDLISLTQELADWKLLDHVGGAYALARLQTFLPTSANVEYYADILADKFTLRGMISLAKKIGDAAYDSQWQSVEDLLSETQISLKSLVGKSRDRTPEVKSVMDFLQADPESTLLGNRWLCRGGALLVIGSSGIGKSSSSMQQDLLWSAGMEAFGIRPTKPLKIITIQAENDDGDMHDMREGVMRGLDLNEAAKGLVRRNFLCCFEQSRTGIEFVENVVRPLLRKHRPDLLRIDPLAAYAGCDITQASESAALLRNALNPLLTEFQCGLVLVHHTPKTTSRDTKEWKPTDWMYSGAGSADIVNWARAILIINPSHEPGKFQFMAAKRGARIGWAAEDGIKQDSRWYQWAPDGYHWIPSDPAAPRETKPKAREKNGDKSGQFKSIYSVEQIYDELKEATVPLRPGHLFNRLRESTGMGKSTFWELWATAKSSTCVKEIPNQKNLFVWSE